MAKKKFAKRIAIGAAVAGAAGYVAGLLTAPNSGKKTRKELKKTAYTNFSDAEKQLKSLHSELGVLVDDARAHSVDLQGKATKKFSSALEEAKVSKDKLRDIISAVHEGDADDMDLKHALKDAKHAVDHLKDFVKK